MDTSRDELFALATANRLLAADLFEGLTDDEWRTPSLCAGWTVREVLAHLVPPEGGHSPWRLLREVVRARGDLHRMVDDTTRRDARRPAADLVRDLRERAATPLSAPVVGAHGPLADSAIHLRDAARPLGRDVGPDPAGWRPVLDFVVSGRRASGFVPKGRLTGLRLVATDQDWAHGDGAEVRGTSEALALAVSGRPVVLPELTGPGVATLEDHIS
ncbi:maleylpyruvate isomerase family mycothiol-dependent enzyme [Nocardioides aurantiacus]|uniref:maleylpyruvate isomerase family mycothiol-dependent enzyme n=1 Tax=Nocardioides aurantiacus TaxID=86796 RepID=UPI000F46D580|nr:maleylpyruvate isomerase family mycothiol-dependent enzyme [Nocardioides aurantiacus]